MNSDSPQLPSRLRNARKLACDHGPENTCPCRLLPAATVLRTRLEPARRGKPSCLRWNGVNDERSLPLFSPSGMRLTTSEKPNASHFRTRLFPLPADATTFTGKA